MTTEDEKAYRAALLMIAESVRKHIQDPKFIADPATVGMTDAYRLARDVAFACVPSEVFRYRVAMTPRLKERVPKDMMPAKVDWRTGQSVPG